ncbi:MAG: universal stress protein [Methanosarcinales archaeon]|nr:universal stress protein [Methanosarcinales archaeon]
MESELYKKILIATDGSDNTRKAIKYGIELARIADADVYAVYVLDAGAFAALPMDAAWESMYELLRTEGSEALKYVEDAGSEAGVPVEGVILDGHPAHEIVDYATENEIDLIVMGTLGRTGLDRILLGSVASKVVHTSDIPVMIIRGGQYSEDAL